jgi:hypothetical protein
MTSYGSFKKDGWKVRLAEISLIIVLVIVTVSVDSLSRCYAQASPTPTPGPAVLHKLNAIGNATEATALSCTNVACATSDVCDYYTISGQIQPFNAFGKLLSNPSVFICISEDTNFAVSNGNDGTTCAPASGTVLLAKGKGNNVQMSLAGQVCTLPDTASAIVNVINAAFAITGSTVNSVSRGSGNFNAFFNDATSVDNSSFTFNGNFSK